MSANKKLVLIIAGPTASGKSGLALEFARRHNGVVINADAMQIYNIYPILSAQPCAAERAEIPHDLYSALRPPALGTAASWREAAEKAIDKALAQNQLPIVVGGTGMYLEFLLHGLSELPDVPENIREQARSEYEANPKAISQKLQQIDPELASRLKPNDRQRIIRAYEIYLATGKPLSEWQKQEFKPPQHAWRHTSILLDPPRETLYAQIDKRFDAMIENGALDEVKKALHHNLPGDHPSQKTIGVNELIAHLKGQLTLDAAKQKASQLSRNYAKRQVTWFRNRFVKNEEKAGSQVIRKESATEIGTSRIPAPL